MTNTKGKTYETHDNGGRSFFVTVSGKKCSVEKNMDTYDLVNGEFTTIHTTHQLRFDTTLDDMLSGKKSPTGGYDGLKPSEAEGNSILVRDGSTYMFIGHEIFEFKPIKGDIIEKYYSDIGNSDVSYPYAIGKTHIYILLDKVAVEKSYFDMKKHIYKQYYLPHTLGMCLRGYQPTNICEDREKAREQMKDLKDKTTKLKTKLIQKRL